MNFNELQNVFWYFLFNILFNISSKFFDLVTFHAAPMFQKEHEKLFVHFS